MAARTQNPLNPPGPPSSTNGPSLSGNSPVAGSRTTWPERAPSLSERPLLEVEDLWVAFEGHLVLRNIHLQVPRGQTLAVIGESGCGKTVLLKTLIGLIRPSRGLVIFDGLNLSQLAEKELTRQRKRFGFLFQQAALFDSMTVYQNVAFPLRQHTSKSERRFVRWYWPGWRRWGYRRRY
jgi:ABC-type glutathione transport system ATPase component